MEKRYCVRFIRCDGAIPPIENYYYGNLEDAKAHFDIFNDNDPDFKEMYERVQLITIYGNLSTASYEICFSK